MSNHIERALLLIGQSRFEPAEKELRQELSKDPDNPTVHSLLALCLSHRKQFREALEEAKTGVRMAPDDPHAHYILASVYNDKDDFNRAEESVREALRLDPEDPDYYALASNILYHRREWKKALDFAEQALARDPKHVTSLNLRGLALRQLNRHDEARATIASALEEDPENAWSHASKGWSVLEQGDHRAALEHFREALRLDSELDWAREGMIEALKAKNVLYRIALKYFFFMSKLSGKAQWGVLIGAYILYSVLRRAAKTNPDLAPFVWPVLGAYIAFIFLSWTAEPLFNLLLRLHPFGRYALKRDEVMAANLVGLTILTAVAALAAFLATKEAVPLLLTLWAVSLIIPVSAAFTAKRGKGRTVLIVLVALLAPAGLAAAVLFPTAIGVSTSLGGGFLLGIALFPWVANAVALRA